MKEIEPKHSNLKEARELGTGLLVVLALCGTASGISYGAIKGVQALSDANNAHNAQSLTTETKLLQEKGLLGQQPLVDLREVPNFNFNGQIAGGFLFVTGTFHGETTQMMEFAWKPNDKDIQISSVPVRNVKYLVFDDPNTKPTVQFTGIKPEQLVGSYINRSDNVNDFVDMAADQITLITLSQKDYNSFRGTQAK